MKRINKTMDRGHRKFGRQKGISLVGLILVAAIALAATVASVIVYEKSNKKPARTTTAPKENHRVSSPTTKPQESQKDSSAFRNKDPHAPEQPVSRPASKKRNRYDEAMTLVDSDEWSDAWGALHKHIGQHRTDVEARKAYVLLQQLTSVRESLDSIEAEMGRTSDTSRLEHLRSKADKLDNVLGGIGIPSVDRFKSLINAKMRLQSGISKIKVVEDLLRNLAAAEKARKAKQYSLELHHLTKAAKYNKSIGLRAKQCALLIKGIGLHEGKKYDDALDTLERIASNDPHYSVTHDRILVIEKAKNEQEYVYATNKSLAALDWPKLRSATETMRGQKGLSPRMRLIVGFATALWEAHEEYKKAQKEEDLGSIFNSIEGIRDAYKSLILAGMDPNKTRPFQQWMGRERETVNRRIKETIRIHQTEIAKAKKAYDGNPIAIEMIDSWNMKTNFSQIEGQIKALNRLCRAMDSLSRIITLLEEEDRRKYEDEIKRQRASITKICKKIFNRAYVLEVQYNEMELAKKLYAVCGQFLSNDENRYPVQARKRLHNLNKVDNP